jgi:hypothetical protein
VSKQTNEPAYRAYSVIKRQGADDFWLQIGAAFPHQSGDGMNVILQALPLPDGDGLCKIVLRPPKDDQQSEGGGRGGNDNRKSGFQRR